MAANVYPPHLSAATASFVVTVTYTAAANTMNGGATGTYTFAGTPTNVAQWEVLDVLDRLQREGAVTPT